jgi:16S rRNA (guanine1207-N2)-methyltransferase
VPRPDRVAQAVLTGALTPPATGDVLAIRATSPALGAAIDPARLICEQSFRPDHDALLAAGLRVVVRAEAAAGMAVVALTRSRAENLGAVARALALVPAGGLVALDGAKTDGIDSLARQVGRVLPLAGGFAKAHGRVVWLVRPAALPPEVAAWAAAAAPSRNAAGFMTAPGMFSPEGPDPGSARLAAAVEGRLAGRVADLGAGWGWLAAAALARSPGIAAIDLYEAEARALDCARTNVDDPRAAFHWVDVRRLGRADPPCDAALLNPPFHTGRAAAPELGASFVAAAARLLKPSGRLWMVANRQLPYEAALDAAFGRWEKLSEDKAFKVLAADRPRRA